MFTCTGWVSFRKQVVKRFVELAAFVWASVYRPAVSEGVGVRVLARCCIWRPTGNYYRAGVKSADLGAGGIQSSQRGWGGGVHLSFIPNIVPEMCQLICGAESLYEILRVCSETFSRQTAGTSDEPNEDRTNIDSPFSIRTLSCLKWTHAPFCHSGSAQVAALTAGVGCHDSLSILYVCVSSSSSSCFH